jgi:peptidyl-dipeptidase Dcp
MTPRRRATLGLAAALGAACATPAPPPPAPPPAAAVALDPHAEAVQRVARLTAEAEQDVLLAPWSGPYEGVPPFDRVEVARFPAAFEKGLALLLAEVEVIATSSATPTFDNVVAALERASRHQDRAETLFAIHNSNLSSKEVQAIDREWSPKITAANDRIVFDPRMFARLSAVYAGRATAGLTVAQQRLVERMYQRFVRAGAQLDDAQKAKLGELNQALARAFTQFGSRVLADENTWIVIEKEADLAGLSDSLRAAYAAEAKERGLEGKWVVTNTRSSVDPFLASSTRRELRQKVWEAFKRRGENGNENDTREIILEIVRLRAERAKLLGFASHAHWRMADTMAVDPEKARALMQRVWPAAVGRVGEEVRDMTKLARKDGIKGAFEPWDYLFYAEKVRKARFAIDEAELKPYFQLEKMVAASFFMAEKLYGLTFTEITSKVPGFHPDVRVWEVKDASRPGWFGLFYGDYFARAGKRSGAWQMTYRGHETFEGHEVHPIASNNNNFVKGAPGEPVLISLDDANTLFHEFGHAIHVFLSEVEYPGLSSTPRDFVEYPSQVHEMWVMTRTILDGFARHVKTGAVMPQALLDKVARAAKFNSGYASVEYLSSALLDMELHMRTEPITDVSAFERDTLKALGAPREVAMRHRLPHFNHLFTSDAYSAGYYSYLWSEVMDADTRRAFVEAGDPFHAETAAKMRRFILAPGNTTDRAEAYRAFRGRDPDVAALFEKKGFAPPK